MSGNDTMKRIDVTCRLGSKSCCGSANKSGCRPTGSLLTSTMQSGVQKSERVCRAHG